MLVMRRMSPPRDNGDEGVALVAVIVVMFVGVVIAAAVAASVMFTLRQNTLNRSTTQAFIAAESGRDAVVAKIADGCSGDGEMRAGGTAPQYDATAVPVTGAVPTPFTVDPTAAVCPTKDTDYVVIESTGTGPDGSTSTIQSVYRWSATYSDVPGGVVTYFSGSVTQGVSHYTGDMVLRNGNWSCTEGGTLDGDLYVVSGTVALSNNCVILGDIWADKNVASNSLSWHVRANARTGSHGDITTNGAVDFTSNGAPTVDGKITAKGNVALKNGGSDTGKVTGTVTSKQAAPTIGSQWTTGTPSKSSDDPVFVPSLAWLLQATKWLDLDNTSGWGAITAGTCSALKNNGTASAYIAGLIGAGTTPLTLDFTGCNKDNAVRFTLGAGTKLTREVTIIAGPKQQMTVSLSGVTSNGPHQLFLVHADANRNDVDAEGAPKPTCGNGNQEDTFGTVGAVAANLKVMVYSPCGLNGNVEASFSGQLYTNDTTNFHAGSAYTCATMSWPGALEKLSCSIKGEGGIIDDTDIVQKLGALVSQSETP